MDRRATVILQYAHQLACVGWEAIGKNRTAGKILGINNCVLFAVVNAALFSLIEIFLASTPAFIWGYPWWGALPVFITTYIPFFLAAFLVPDAKPKTQHLFIGSLAALNVLLLCVLIPLGVI